MYGQVQTTCIIAVKVVVTVRNPALGKPCIYVHIVILTMDGHLGHDLRRTAYSLQNPRECKPNYNRPSTFLVCWNGHGFATLPIHG